MKNLSTFVLQKNLSFIEAIKKINDRDFLEIGPTSYELSLAKENSTNSEKIGGLTVSRKPIIAAVAKEFNLRKSTANRVLDGLDLESARKMEKQAYKKKGSS